MWLTRPPSSGWSRCPGTWPGLAQSKAVSRPLSREPSQSSQAAAGSGILLELQLPLHQRSAGACWLSHSLVVLPLPQPRHSPDPADVHQSFRLSWPLPLWAGAQWGLLELRSASGLAPWPLLHPFLGGAYGWDLRIAHSRPQTNSPLLCVGLPGASSLPSTLFQLCFQQVP